MLAKIALYVAYFFFYSALGWLVESIYCSIPAKKWINRGFLTGPLCPIYGTGAVVMSLALSPLKGHPALVFIVGLVLCDVVEFITSYLMEKLFHARWWDYSERWLNIQGRICFRHSMYWGFASLIFIYFIHPNVGERIFLSMSPKTIYIILAVILIIFAFDLANAVRKALDVKGMMDKIHNLNGTVAKIYSDISENVSRQKEKIKAAVSENASTVLETREAVSLFFKRGRKGNRMVENYPYLESGSNKQLKKLDSLIDDIKHLLIDSDSEMF